MADTRPRILVADDDPTALLLAQAALERAGFEPICVEHGARALERFQNEAIDLVVLDVEMPTLDGFGACSAIRACPDRGEHTPILMVTGREDLASIERAYEAGANDFVTKPVEWTIFCQRVRYMLRASQALERVRVAQAEAERANQAKRQFLARASHELRTPLSAILGFLDLIEPADDGHPSRYGDLSPEEAIRSARRNAEHLVRLVDDLLDLSRIEAGRLRVALAPFSVAELIQDVTEILRPDARERGLELVAKVDPGAAELISDATRVRQILTNLMANAIKCTHRGRVEVLARPLEGEGRRGVELVVRDTGVGMTREQLRRAFEPFMQGEDSAVQGRAGLGLAVVRELAGALGGNVAAASTPGKGTAFRVTLPSFDPAPKTWEPSGSGPLPEGVLHGSRILVVDDGPDNRRLIDVLLRRAGASVTLAEDGREGARCAYEAHRRNEPFDVVLMDLQMPVLGGTEATQALRKAGYPHPIVALTAAAVEGERERCLAAGLDGYLTKPIDRALLVRELCGWIAKRRMA
jgi:signal transduction histidine kinase